MPVTYPCEYNGVILQKQTWNYKPVVNKEPRARFQDRIASGGT
jgi:hypothetical protein